MKKWSLVIDVARCFGCQACAVACHDEYHGNEHPGVSAPMAKHGQRWIDLVQREQGGAPMVEVSYLPVTCNHCDDAPCIKAAKNGAVRKRDDGIVIVDPVKAKGQRQLVAACPYGAMFWNDELDLPQAWPFDAHLLDAGWKRTRASQVCPTQAIRTVRADDAEMERIVQEEHLEVLHPQHRTRPRVWYKNLDRHTKAFVGGSIAGPVNGTVECIEGARVTLVRDGRRLASTASDPYGEFRFRGLDEKTGGYRIEIEEDRFAPHSMTFDLANSTYLGTISLRPR
jgi:Fe-S-cluster-containing dehydrogenase component